MSDNNSKPELPTSASPSDRKLAGRRRLLFWGQLIVVLLVVAPLLWGYVLRPLKYRYLIRRIESAQSGSEESAAFRLAADWGRLFEVNRVDPQYAAAKGLPSPQAAWIRIEWLNGESVLHRLIDTNNLAILLHKKYSHSLGESLL